MINWLAPAIALFLMTGYLFAETPDKAKLRNPELDTADITRKTGINEIQVLDSYIMQEIAAGNATSPKVIALQRIRNQLILAATASKNRSKEERDLIKSLGKVLEKKINPDRPSRDTLVDLGMYHLLTDNPIKALSAFEQAGAASEEDCYYPIIMAYVSTRLGDYTRGREYIQRVNRLMEKKKPLLLSEAAFCTTVSAFRDFIKRKEMPFKPGEDTLVYVEIDGVRFRKKAGQLVSAHLTFGVEIRDELQEIAWSKPEFGSYTPSYQGMVRDFHASLALRIPNHLKSGSYHLKIKCTDHYANRTGNTVIDFAIGISKPGTDKKEPEQKTLPNIKDEKISEVLQRHLRATNPN